MNNSIIQSVMNMTADVYTQHNTQASASGTIVRKWLYDQTIPCKIEPIANGGGRHDSKKFATGQHAGYIEQLQLKMKCLNAISKRWRIHNIRSNDGKQVYTEIDKIDSPDTIFEVLSSHAVLDPFGRISYYEVTLQRVQVQNDNNKGE